MFLKLPPVTSAATILAQVDFAETHPPNAPRYSRSVTTPFSSRFRSRRQYPGLLHSLLPSSRHPTPILVTFRRHSVRKIPLAFGGTSSYTFARTRYSLSPRIPLLLPRRVVLSLSGGLSSSLFLSHMFSFFSYMPNYPNVTGVARRLFQANSQDFRKFIGPRSRNSQPNRLHGRT